MDCIRANLKVLESSTVVETNAAKPLVTATYVGVLLFIALYYFRPEDFIPGVAFVPLAKIVGVFTGASLVLAILCRKVRLVPEIGLVLGLFAYLCLCILGSSWPGGSFEAVVNGFSKVILVAIAAMCALTTVSRLRRVILVQTFAMLTMALLSLGHRQPGRMFGVGNMFDDPNDLALNLCIILPFCIAFLLSSVSWPWKAFWTVAVVVTLFAIISTYSRGGFLALLAVLLVMWRRFSISPRTAALLLVLIVLLPTAAILAVGKSSFAERMHTIIDPNADTTGSAQERRELLTRSLEETLRHPIFGIGPAQFGNGGLWHQTHNSYTQLSSEAGLPALMIFLALMRQTFRNLRRIRSVPKRSQVGYLAGALYCAMTGYLVGAFFLSTAFWLVPYLLASYGLALRRVSEDTDMAISDEATVQQFP